MVQYPTPLGMHRRFTILVGATDTVWALFALIIAIVDLIAGKIGQDENTVHGWLAAFFFVVLICVIGFGIVLIWGAKVENPRLLLTWLIPNIIVMSIVLFFVFGGVFEADKNNYILFSIIGFVLVRAAAVLKVYEMYLHIKEKKVDAAHLCDEMETEFQV